MKFRCVLFVCVGVRLYESVRVCARCVTIVINDLVSASIHITFTVDHLH